MLKHSPGMESFKGNSERCEKTPRKEDKSLVTSEHEIVLGICFYVPPRCSR